MVRRPRHGAFGMVDGMNLTTSPRAETHHPESRKSTGSPESSESPEAALVGRALVKT